MSIGKEEPSVRFLQFGNALYRHVIDQVLNPHSIDESSQSPQEQNIYELTMKHNRLVKILEKEYTDHIRKLLMQKHEFEDIFNNPRLHHLQKQSEKEYRTHFNHLLMQKNAILIHLQLKFHKQKEKMKENQKRNLTTKPRPFIIHNSPIKKGNKPDLSPNTMKRLSNLSVD